METRIMDKAHGTRPVVFGEVLFDQVMARDLQGYNSSTKLLGHPSLAGDDGFGALQTGNHLGVGQLLCPEEVEFRILKR